MITINEKQILNFFDKVELSPGSSCWHWTAKKSNAGYGNVSLYDTDYIAHRVSWQIHFGQIPEGLLVMHKCDVRHCVNPGHLSLGTHKDNSQDMIQKKRSPWHNKTHCVRGHEFNESNTKWEGTFRRCIACNKIKNKRAWQKRKAARSTEDQCNLPMD